MNKVSCIGEVHQACVKAGLPDHQKCHPKGTVNWFACWRFVLEHLGMKTFASAEYTLALHTHLTEVKKPMQCN